LLYPRNVEKTVTVNGVAKAFAMTQDAELVILARPNLLRFRTKIQGQVTSG
jgi:hypothetical protein